MIPTKVRTQRIFAIALPIMGGMVSQSILNLVDAYFVGKLGSVALASVGLGSYAAFLAAALVLGLGSGVQATVARRKGEGDPSNFAIPLNSGLILAIIIAVPLMAFFFLISTPLMQLLSSDPLVASASSDYFTARVPGILALGLNFSFRGYWNGINRSMVYMRTLIVMHISNAILSYGFIFGAFGLPELGVYGAGLGTTLALFIASVLYFIQCYMQARPSGFLAQRPTAEALRTLFKLSFPASIQQFFFAAGLTALFWIVGQIGTPELSVVHVLITFVLFLILPSMGMGLGAASLVGQALGRGDKDDAYQWGKDVTVLAIIMLTTISLPLLFFPDFALGFFLHEQHLIDLGRTPLQLSALFIGVDAAGLVLMHTLLGAGDSKTVMKITITTQWLLFLPAAFIVGPILGYGLFSVWVLQLLQRLLVALGLSYQWRKRQWAHIKL